MSTPTRIAGLTDVGRVRKRNEDALVLAPDLGVAVVADGMGGHPGGDVASRLAAEAAAATLTEYLQLGGEGSDLTLGETMERSVRRAHDAIREEGRREPELDGMGTTLSALVLDPRGGRFVVGHVGDSRVYRLRGGALTQLTRDDTWVQERVDANDLTEEQARRHPFGHILTQCLGLEEAPRPQILEGEVVGGDAYLLCTDGLVGMLDDDEVRSILGDALDEAAADIAEALVTAANQRGGYDNVTVALVLVG